MTQYLLEPLMEMPENNHMDAMLLRHVIYLKYLIEVTMLLESTSWEIWLDDSRPWWGRLFFVTADKRILARYVVGVVDLENVALERLLLSHLPGGKFRASVPTAGCLDELVQPARDLNFEILVA